MSQETFQTIVVSPIGEPGCGKSTFSLWLAHELKMRGINAEFVPEVIKYESYSDEARARVVSGLYDERLLRHQHRLTKPLVGKVEVIVNDGALEPFYYYSLLRVSPERLPGLRAMMDRYLDETSACEHRFVSPVRQHAYETAGRRQREDEAQAMREHLLGVLKQEFSITPTLLDGQQAREDYLDALVKDVMQRRVRRNPTPSRSRSP
jgi:hypothetical protein